MALERLDFAGERFLFLDDKYIDFDVKKRLGANPEPPRAICDCVLVGVCQTYSLHWY